MARSRDASLECIPETTYVPDTQSDDSFDQDNSPSSTSPTYANLASPSADPLSELEEVLSWAGCNRVSISEVSGCKVRISATATAESVLPKTNWIKLEFDRMSPSRGNRITLRNREDDDLPMESEAMKLTNSLAGIKSDDDDCLKVLEMVPKPALSVDGVTLEGVMYFSDVVLVWSVLKDKSIQMFWDPQKTCLHATRDLKLTLSVQSEGQRKFNKGKTLHCFRLVLGSPKKDKTVDQHNESYPGWILTNKKSGNVQLLTLSYTFGVSSELERGTWMANIVQSLTAVFPKVCLDEFTIAGWCYTKSSVASSWSGGWILLSKRSLYIYSEATQRLEHINLRKARCIEEIKSDDSIGYLYVEVGPVLFINCPPQNSVYCIMGTQKETQNWRALIQKSAHQNGEDFESQQLTESDVPVLIEKCINFVYTYGSRSEAIYHKSGSCVKIEQILQLFKKNAFAVQLLRTEYNQHDVAGALCRFIRINAGTLFGKYSMDFICLASLPYSADKIASFTELLSRLRSLEYNTLKKIIGHLRFIVTQKEYNKMDVQNLATIWSTTLLYNSELEGSSKADTYREDGVILLSDLINLYANLFPISSEEILKEKLISQVLQKMYQVDNKLTSLMKAPQGLLIWINIDCNEGNNAQASKEDKLQASVLVTPAMIASDICKQLASKTNCSWYELTLYEVVVNGSLMRPIHNTEKVLPIVQRWGKWDEEDRITNFLALRPISMVSDIHRYIQKASALIPSTDLYFADQQNKLLQKHKLQMIGREIVVLKEVSKSKGECQEVMKIDVGSVHAYFGGEPKRRQLSLRWSITLVENGFRTRTQESPFIGHVFGGVDYGDQLMWYSSIWYSLYKEDIIPKKQA